ncbi:MAG: hypothetical protein ABL891_09550 [Burkholderiales bacterium]
MAISRSLVVAALLLLAFSARAQEAAKLPPTVPDVIYKGIVGKALDAVPMNPEKRLVLQRTNAVVSSTFAGRSLAAWAGLSNPVLLAAGVAWGIYSAMNIKAAQADMKPDASRIEPGPVQIAHGMALMPAMDTEATECSPDALAADSAAVATEAELTHASPTWAQAATRSDTADNASVRF